MDATRVGRRPVYICRSCLQAQRRAVSTSFLIKIREGKEQWQGWADEIRAGKRMSPLETLKSRGYVHDIVGSETAFDNLLIDKRVGVYCGVDPTAPSLHIGHMLPFMALFWMHISGFHTISLLGGATAAVGDPTGRSYDRKSSTNTERRSNIVAMHYQLKRLWVNLERTAERHGYVYEKYWKRGINNNAVWYNKLPFTEVIKQLGTGIRMGDLLRKDNVKTKLNSKDGMSFAEFCYPIMQSYDWWHMYCQQDIQVQIGGKDQFGNISAGVEAIKYMAATHHDPNVRQQGGVIPETAPCGFTTPLLTSSDGKKLGKSGGNAVWLDENMTSLFDQYAFFVKTPDADVEQFLKYFTFISLDGIKMVMDEHNKEPSKRVAQKTLAYEFMHLIHGATNADNMQKKYEQMADARREMSMKDLVGNAYAQPSTEQGPDAATSSEDTVPSNIKTTPITTEEPKSNPWSNHSFVPNAAKSKYITQSLNPYAGPVDPNNKGGGVEHVVLPKSIVYGQSIGRIFYAAGLVSSRSEGHRVAANKGAYVGRKSGKDIQMGDSLIFHPTFHFNDEILERVIMRDGDLMADPDELGLLVLRIGKWRIRSVRVVSDARFQQMGLPDPPGWAELQSIKAAGLAKEQLDKTYQEQPGYLVREAEDKAREAKVEAAGLAAKQRALDEFSAQERAASMRTPKASQRRRELANQETAAIEYLKGRARAERELDQEAEKSRRAKEADFKREQGQPADFRYSKVKDDFSARLRRTQMGEETSDREPIRKEYDRPINEEIDTSRLPAESAEQPPGESEEKPDASAEDFMYSPMKETLGADEEPERGPPSFKTASLPKPTGAPYESEAANQSDREFERMLQGADQDETSDLPYSGLAGKATTAVDGEGSRSSGEGEPSSANTTTQQQSEPSPSSSGPASSRLAGTSSSSATAASDTQPSDEASAMTPPPSAPPNHKIFPWQVIPPPRPPRSPTQGAAAKLRALRTADLERRSKVVAEMRARGDSLAEIGEQVTATRHLAQRKQRIDHETLRREWLAGKTKSLGRTLAERKLPKTYRAGNDQAPAQARETERNYVEWKRQITAEARVRRQKNELLAAEKRRAVRKARHAAREYDRRYPLEEE